MDPVPDELVWIDVDQIQAFVGTTTIAGTGLS